MNKRASLAVGKTLSDLRTARGLSRKDLADRIGISEALVSHWENDLRQPTLYMASRLAGELGITIDDLVADAEHVS